MRMFLVKNLMYTEFPTANGQISITDAAKILTQQARSFMIIVQGDVPIGVVTEQDFVRKVISKRIAPERTKVSEIMSHPAVTIGPDADLSDAAEVMNKSGINKLVVVEEKGKLLGVITHRLLVQHFNEYVNKITRELVRHSSFVHFV